MKGRDKIKGGGGYFKWPELAVNVPVELAARVKCQSRLIVYIRICSQPAGFTNAPNYSRVHSWCTH